MAGIACYHVARLIGSRILRRRAEPDVDLTHTAMGVAMATMLATSPASALRYGFASVFVVSTLWFVGRATRAYLLETGRTGHDLRQVIAGVAMLFMLTSDIPGGSATSMPGMAMDGTAGSPYSGFGLLLAALMAGVAVWLVALIPASLRPNGPASPLALAPATTTVCQLAMTLTTVYMLATAL